MATEADVLLRPNGEKQFFELVEGVLVEKPMGYYESLSSARVLREDESLDGGTVLPGFHLSIRDLFDQAGHRQGPS
jgi:hypothetical protein